MESTGSASRTQIIAEIYEVVLKPDRYDRFMALWDDYLSDKVPHATGPDDLATDRTVEDSELESHFRRAYEIMERMGRAGRRRSTPQAEIDALALPAIAIGKDRSVTAASDDAGDFFGRAERLSDIEERADPDDVRRLRELLMGVDRPTSSGQAAVLRFVTDTNQGPIARIAIARPVFFETIGEVQVLLSALAVEWSAGLEALLRESFGITRHEAEVLRELCAGANPETVAQSRNRSLHTVRTQVKSLLQRTGTQSQAELIRLATAIAAHVAHDERLKLGQPPTGRPANDSIISIAIDNTRSIPVHLIGPRDGRPVVFIHGMLDGIAMPARIIRELERANICLLAPERPSFGSSPPAYGIRTAPAEFATDLERILDRLSIGRAPILGHKAGAMYAYAAAGSLGDRISGIVSVAGGVPIRRMSQFLDMAPRQRVVALTARFAPALLPSILRAGISQIDTGSEEEFMNALYQPGTVDRVATESRSVREAVKSGYHFAVAQGHRGFEIDAWHSVRDWTPLIEAVRCPVVMIHGADDPVVTIASVRAFAARHRIELREQADAGQLVLFQKPEAITGLLADILDLKAAAA